MAGRVIWCLLPTLCIANAKSLGYQYGNPHADLHSKVGPSTVNIGGHPAGFVAPSIAPATGAGAQYATSLQASLTTALPNLDAQVSSTVAPTLIPGGPLSFGGELIAHSAGLGFGGDFSAFGLNGAHFNALPVAAALPFGAQPTGWEAFPTAAALIGANGDSGFLSSPAPSLETTFGLAQQTPIVKTQFYLHSAPEEHNEIATTKHFTIGRPQKNYRVVFINAPSASAAKAHVSVDVAPQEEKTVIYVLSQKQDKVKVDGVVSGGENALSKPEVFFIKYKTAEEALHAQQEIQAQYDALGGSTQVSDEGVAPVTSVIGSLGQVDAASALAAAPPLHILGQHSLAATPPTLFASTTLAPSLAPTFHAPTTIAPTLSAFNAPFQSAFNAPFHHTPTTIAPALSEFNSPSLHLLGQHLLPATAAPSFVSTTLAPSLASLQHTPTTIAPALSAFSAESLPILGQHSLPASPAPSFVSTTLAPSLAPLHHASTTFAPALSAFNEETLPILGQHSLPASPAPAILSTSLAPSLAPLHQAATTAAAEFSSPSLPILGHESFEAAPVAPSLAPLEQASSTIASELFPSSTIASSIAPVDHAVPSTIAPALSTINDGDAAPLSSVHPTFASTLAPSAEIEPIDAASIEPALPTVSHNINAELASTATALSADSSVSPFGHVAVKPTLPTVTHNGAPKTSFFQHASTTLAPSTSTIGYVSPTIASAAPAFPTFASYEPPAYSPSTSRLIHNGAPKNSFFQHASTTLAPSTSTIGYVSPTITSAAPAFPTFASYGPPAYSPSTSRLTSVKPTFPTIRARGPVRFAATSTISPFLGSAQPTVSSTFATSTEFVQPTTNSHSLLTSFSFGSGHSFKSSLPTLEPESAPFKGLSRSHVTISPRRDGFKKRQRH